MTEQNILSTKTKRMQFSNLKSTKEFRDFVRELLNIQDERCYYCKEKVYVEEKISYDYPKEWYMEGGSLYGSSDYFIDRTWTYHIDHKIPLSADGTNDPDNLVIACVSCNCSKGAQLQWQKA